MTRRIVQAPQLSSLHLEVREGLGLDARGVFENEWFSGEFERNLQGMSLTGCMVADSSLDGIDLSSSTFTECELTGLDAPGWRMARTVLRDVEVADSPLWRCRFRRSGPLFGEVQGVQIRLD